VSRILLKRIYDPPERSDGFRVLIDRLWPRGIRKEDAAIDLWAKEIAPSPALRTWFHKDPAGRWEQFGERYRRELDAQNDLLQALRLRAKHMPVTLLFGTKDVEHTHVIVLKNILEKK
jgi:uncharacterized protein YeaO (DUF488 family)